MKVLYSLALAALTFLGSVAIPQTLTSPVAKAEVTPLVPCATASLSVDPTTVKRGRSVSIKGKFTNCSTDTRKYKLFFKLGGPDGFKIDIGPFTVIAAKNQSASKTVSVTVPSFAPTGSYSATVLVKSANGVLLDTASAGLLVTK
ncbi:MAG: hypothetical protein WCD18_25090 [Thermosynechococcaceae cyanobacterium]